MSHTPGPWTLEETGDCALVLARGAVVSGVVASINTRWAHESQCAEQNANARLIAAAPELLEALEAAITANIAPMPKHYRSVGAEPVWAVNARAVIKKARDE